ncbi:hypothetical protein [Alicyclobacillus macrosporangiidus]|uniref:Uncharacterized protein n=1 Tax=Alicyclobacillus macrosporangiidus TaxID=392015 RepID=A0A1I7IBM7_9BACL|nr:hypothetical protein [Alicyclobacillus macrosporangiidus]SFU70334.1 hypothetical protein SAMN05421543_106116 [Alicyclobacillus macrosporangiidus]
MSTAPVIQSPAPPTVECFICHRQHPIQATVQLATGERVCEAPECRGTVVQCDYCEELFYDEDIHLSRAGVNLCGTCARKHAEAFDWRWIEA